MSKYRIKLNGKEYELEVEAMDGSVPAPKSPATKAVATPAPSAASASKASAAPASKGAVISPMPGTILKVNKAQGDTIKAGESVVVLEAMKMENDITAPADGVIKSLNVSQGQTVSKGDVLFEVE